MARLPQAAPAPKPEPAKAKANPNLTHFDGTASGGSIPGDGVPVTLDVNLSDPAGVTGTFGYPNYHSAAIKDATFNKETGELKFTWESPRGTSKYTFKIDGDHINGSTPLPSGGEITVAGKKGADTQEEAKPTGPTLEERVFLAGPAGFISSSVGRACPHLIHPGLAPPRLRQPAAGCRGPGPRLRLRLHELSPRGWRQLRGRDQRARHFHQGPHPRLQHHRRDQGH
jgi:hypothetical protein